MRRVFESGVRVSLYLCTVMVALMAMGCLGTAQRGDRAFKSGDCDTALKLYEEAIKEQSRDPDVFFRAAQCATRLGAFSQAERYYSRALRYGGGPKVARALAKLYLKTSNYARAVRVLQALLNDKRVEPQPVYNNLGTALMYAGEPLDAESYLLIAQQMNPKDPFPYINLGLLYDRHLKRPSLALGFYKCYIALLKNAPQSRTVQLRMYELKRAKHVTSDDVVCGKVYKHKGPRKNAFAKLQELKAQSKKDDAKKVATPKNALDPNDKTYNTTPATKTNIIVERGGQLPKDSKVVVDKSQHQLEQRARTKARQSFFDRKYKETLTTLGSIPTQQLNSDDAVLFAKSYNALKQIDQAEVWYRIAFQKNADTLYFHSLVNFLRTHKKTKKLKALCAKHRKNDAYTAVIALCPQ